jgi:hypothetical protein
MRWQIFNIFLKIVLEEAVPVYAHLCAYGEEIFFYLNLQREHLKIY